uniref:Uncharacterized protein n=1 Tax=Anguilla anguilla TaxID=7936 RepID=A0A0E9RRS2_ANGAN
MKDPTPSDFHIGVCFFFFWYRLPLSIVLYASPLERIL